MSLKPKLDKDVEAIVDIGKFQAYIRYVPTPYVLEVFVREKGVEGAQWLIHRQAHRFERDKVLLPPSGAQFN